MFLSVDVDPTSSSPASKDMVLQVLRKHLMSVFVCVFFFFFQFSKLRLICVALDVAGTHSVAVQPVLPPGLPAPGTSSPPSIPDVGQGGEKAPWELGVPPGAEEPAGAGVAASAAFCLPVQLLQAAEFGCRGAGSL